MNSERSDIDDFVRGLLAEGDVFQTRNARITEFRCSLCAEVRAAEVSVTFAIPRSADALKGYTPQQVISALTPSMFIVRCTGCSGEMTCVVYDSFGVSRLARLPSRGPLLRRAPEGVRFYLEQARLSECVDANSAAVAMYRSALEHLLASQGYGAGMLSNRIEELRDSFAQTEGPAKSALLDSDVDILICLKDLGNLSIHANEGDIGKQSIFSADLVSAIHRTVTELVELLYESPARREQLVRQLRHALGDE